MEKPTYNLFNWSVVGDPSSGIQLAGRREGRDIVTSRVVKASGRTVETLNSIYILKGDMDIEYKKYLDKIGYPFDENNPIKLIESESDRFIPKSELN